MAHEELLDFHVQVSAVNQRAVGWFRRPRVALAHLWAYKRQQFILNYKAMLRGLKHILVSARGTSSKCPTCNRRLRKKDLWGA
ncbi:TPA: hypothetical protein EYP27_03455 [Candidatus Bathyarchaeota archaeon]|nr:hypothetical protein [Candidatus Bathyarchaeota archaeon]